MNCYNKGKMKLGERIEFINSGCDSWYSWILNVRSS